jgi:RNA polymerase sigma-70 factor (ECF subfamily)
MSATPPPGEPDDATLARQARAGDLHAFSRLVGRHQAALFHFLRHRCGNPSDAEDLAQSAFVAAFRALDRFDLRREFRPWLYTIARRQCIDLLRQRREVRPLREAEQAVAPEPEPGLDDRSVQLWHVVERELPPAQSEALWLIYRDGLDFGEAAQVLGWSRVRLKVTLHRARQRLKARLAPQATPSPLVTLPLSRMETP